MGAHAIDHTTKAQPGQAEQAEARVMEALADDRWDFRTIQGIAQQTGLPADAVEEVLTNSEDVRRSDAPSPDGHWLFALKSRPVSVRESLAATRAMITKAF